MRTSITLISLFCLLALTSCSTQTLPKITHTLLTVHTPHGDKDVITVEGQTESPCYDREKHKELLISHRDWQIYRSETEKIQGGKKAMLIVKKTQAPVSLIIDTPDSTYYVSVKASGCLDFSAESHYPALIWYDNKFVTGSEKKKILRHERFQTAYKKGSVKIPLALPWTNNYVVYPSAVNQWRSITGFIGMTVGLEYFYADDKSIDVSFGGMMSFFIPVPAPVCYAGSIMDENVMQLTGNVAANRYYRRFSFGCGLHFTRTMWNYIYYIDARDIEEGYPPPNPILGDESLGNTYLALGPVLKGFYNFNHNVHLGLVYRPSFYRFGPEITKPWVYEHSLSLELRFDINLYNPSKYGTKEK